MNKERDMKPMTKEEEYRNADVPMPKNPQPTDADLQALQDAGVDYADFLKIFFKGKDNDER
jgi:hypothetical protein|tara:strand:+ start:98 stop:280 length:183 start_codon:yes stop_codon:yes gene_type:complete